MASILIRALNTSGVPQWTVNGIVVSNQLKDQLNPNIVEDMQGGAIITWQDSTIMDWDVKAQRVKFDGSLLWQTAGVSVATATGAQTSPKSVSDGHSGCIFSFMDKRSGVNDIYAHHLYSNGTTISDIGINEITSAVNINCYPNPFNTETTLYFSKEQRNATIKIIDVVGKTIETRIFSGDQLVIEKGEMKEGVYFIQVIDENNSVVNKKIVVQ